MEPTAISPVATEAALPASSAPLGWPEPLDAAPRPQDPFPFRLLAPWAFVLVVGLAMLLGLGLFLQRRANKQIAFVDTAGALTLIRADGEGEQSLEVEVSGAPQWSPDGSTLAALDGEGNDLILAQPGAEAPARVALRSATVSSLAPEAWSPDGRVLALLGGFFPGGEVLLLPLDATRTKASAPISDPTPIDTRYPLNWHPQRSELLFSAGEVTSTMQILSADGALRDLLPQDQRAAHWAGAWSDDGRRIAYVAHESARERDWGEIWVAAADGSGPQLIAAGEHNLPIWAPDSRSLVYSSLVTTTGAITLSLVDTQGGAPVSLGEGVPIEWYAQRGVSALVGWSPDGSKLFFQSYSRTSQRFTMYVALADGTGARSLTTSSGAPMTAEWAPTGRSLLVSKGNSQLLLYPITSDSTASLRTLAGGGSPAWQP